LRYQLRIAGVPVGLELTEDAPFTHGRDLANDQGSIIAAVATDAPLLPHQLKRLALRGTMGPARLGSTAANGSGGIFVAFSTEPCKATSQAQPRNRTSQRRRRREDAGQ
jgi:D-aminopeptidase